MHAARAVAAYAGEVSPEEAWAELQRREGAALVDVRTLPEWQFTGQPDLSDVKGRLLSVSWRVYPQMGVNPGFEAALRAEGVNENTPLYFLCRSGGRSLDAAIAMTAAGFKHCYNVTNGFEGEPDSAHHRGITQGWKAAGLPWRQA